MKRLLVIITASFLILSSFLFFQKLVLAASWTKTTVDSDGDVGKYTSITTDDSDNYLIAYYDDDNDDLKFAKSTDGGLSWATTVVDDGCPGISITVDDSDNYLIAYCSSAIALNLAKSTDGGLTWTPTTVDDSTWVLYNISITTDSSDNYLISYRDFSNDDLEFAKSTDGGSSWSTETADSTGHPQWNSITVDLSDNYLISYYDNILYDLKFAKSTDGGGSWSTTTVESDGNVGYYNSIATDSLDNYLISYYDAGNPTLEFTKSTDGGGSWSATTTVESSGSPDGYNSITTDSSDNYLISYYNDSSDDLKFAKSTDGGSSWAAETVDSTGDVGRYTSTTTDSSDNYLISYYDNTGDLKFAKAPPDLAAPSISLTALSPDPNNDTTPSFSGTATDTEGTVSSVQYQMDGTSGSWSSCSADDGTFDEASEAFTCAVSSALSDGSHTIHVRATDSNSNTTSSGSESSDSFTIDATTPTAMTIVFPSGNVAITKPTLFFRKSTDATSGLSSYSVSLDENKNRSFSTTGIPTSGNGSSAYTWKDDNDVKVEFLNEHDADSDNDKIQAYFKGLDSGELKEGKHSWKVTANDSASNSRSQSTDFFIDRTSPSFSELRIAGLSSISSGGIYKLDITKRMPSFSGKAKDAYQGSTRTNDNGTQDTFDKVASGPDKITLNLKKLDQGENPNSANSSYTEYLTEEYSLTDIQDDSDNEKYSSFSITTPFPLADGYYQVNLSLKDQAGNSYSYSAFYLSLKYQGIPVTGTLETEIIREERIPAVTEEEKERIREEGYVVQVKVVDEQENPVEGAKVTLYSEPREKITNEQGIALFERVEPGEHRVVIAYDNQVGEQQITLEGEEVKRFELTIRVKPVKSFLTKPAFLAMVVFLAVVGGFLALVFKKKAFFFS